MLTTKTYPCDAEKILACRDILEAQIDYVWGIGRESRESVNPSVSTHTEAEL